MNQGIRISHEKEFEQQLFLPLTVALGFPQLVLLHSSRGSEAEGLRQGQHVPYSLLHLLLLELLGKHGLHWGLEGFHQL